jgi:hypothetical protein
MNGYQDTRRKSESWTVVRTLRRNNIIELSGASGVKRLRTTSTVKLDLLDIEREGREDG